MVSETIENKGDLKQMKLGIVVHAPVSYKPICPYKSPWMAINKGLSQEQNSLYSRITPYIS